MELDIYPLVNELRSSTSFYIVGAYVYFLMAVAAALAMTSIMIKGNKLLKLCSLASVLLGLYTAYGLGSTFIDSILVESNPVAEKVKSLCQTLAVTNLVSLFLLSLTSIFKKE
jgi:hypothetical protein